jgi:hypothetical protein
MVHSSSCADAIAAPVPSVTLPSPSASAGASASAAASAGTKASASAAPMASGSAEPSVAASPSESIAPTPATLPADLTPVQGGSSNTIVQITLQTLLASPSAVVVHKSDADLSVVACADITNQPLPSLGTAQSALPGLESALPSLAAGLESALPSLLPSTAP